MIHSFESPALIKLLPQNNVARVFSSKGFSIIGTPSFRAAYASLELLGRSSFFTSSESRNNDGLVRGLGAPLFSLRTKIPLWVQEKRLSLLPPYQREKKRSNTPAVGIHPGGDNITPRYLMPRHDSREYSLRDRGESDPGLEIRILRFFVQFSLFHSTHCFLSFLNARLIVPCGIQ